MTKLLIARNIHTLEVMACCDERCYKAVREECVKCPCGGLNHSQGEIKARENCLTLNEYMRNFVVQTFGSDVQLVVKAKMFQLDMFP